MPDDFNEYAAEVESKGWCSQAVLVDGRRFRLNFYDPARLTQEVVDELSSVAAFNEENLIVVSRVTKSAIRKAVEYLAQSGKLDSLTAES